MIANFAFVQHWPMFQICEHDSWRSEASSPMAPNSLPSGDPDPARRLVRHAQQRTWCARKFVSTYFAFLQHQSLTTIDPRDVLYV